MLQMRHRDDGPFCRHDAAVLLRVLFMLPLALMLVTVGAFRPDDKHPYRVWTDDRLRMPESGPLIILQIADVHYANGASTECLDLTPEQMRYKCSDLNSSALMRWMMESERPHLVVFSGDNIMGMDVTDHAGSLRELLAVFAPYGVPHAMVFGNHDDETNLTPGERNMRERLMDVDMASPLSLSHKGPSSVYGIGNYALQVQTHPGTPSHTLYFLDSSSYDVTETVGGYDWLRPSQIEWYNQTSLSLHSRLGASLPPALLFMHIPVPEFELAWHCNKATNAHPIAYTGMGTDQLPDGYYSESGMGIFSTLPGCGPPTPDRCVGVRQELVASPRVASGLWPVLVERGEVVMVNVGHDHTNQFCCPLGPRSVQLCYSGSVGYHAYGQAGWPRRARIIRLFPDGSVDTYVRLDGFSDPPYDIVDFQVIHSPGPGGRSSASDQDKPRFRSGGCSSSQQEGAGAGEGAGTAAGAAAQ